MCVNLASTLSPGEVGPPETVGFCNVSEEEVERARVR